MSDRYFQPISMILHCPCCHVQHIDAPNGEWLNPPHKSHQCQACGWTWRPCDYQTTGVKFITTIGKADHISYVENQAPTAEGPPGQDVSWAGGRNNKLNGGW